MLKRRRLDGGAVDSVKGWFMSRNIQTFLIAIEDVTSFALVWVTPGIFAWTLATSTKLGALSSGE